MIGLGSYFIQKTTTSYMKISIKNVDQVGFYRNLTFIEIFIFVRHSETLRIKFTYIRKSLSAWFNYRITIETRFIVICAMLFE
jgi:hypothetical protein